MSVAYEQIGIIYAVKAAEALFLWVSLFLASTIVQQVYVTRVFVQNFEPPSLHRFVFTFLGIFLAFVVVLMVILFLVKFLYEKPDGSFLLNDGIMTILGGDFVVSCLLITLLAVVLASVMMRKKYFRYKSDGLRAIRCLKELMLIFGCIVLAMPLYRML